MPVEQLFRRFPRMVRDVAKQCGKEVELVVEGAETKVDRVVVDSLYDPLVHMLRNARSVYPSGIHLEEVAVAQALSPRERGEFGVAATLAAFIRRGTSTCPTAPSSSASANFTPGEALRSSSSARTRGIVAGPRATLIRELRAAHAGGVRRAGGRVRPES